MNDQKSPSTTQERLNNEEFRQLIPYLQLDELFAIEIRSQGNWLQMFSVSYKGNKVESITCNICEEHFPLNAFKGHLKAANHIEILDHIELFYHPIYTYAKGDDKLAKGDTVTDEELQAGIVKANAAMDTKAEAAFLEARRIVKSIQNSEIAGVMTSDFEKTLIPLVLKTDARKPEHIFAEVSLPLEELVQLEFSTQKDTWQPMLTTNNVHPNSKYFCALCSKYCAGIIPVNSHINGNFHKNLQLGTLGVRHPSHGHLTKNCSYRYDKKYCLLIKKEGKAYFKGKVLEILNAKKAQTAETVSESKAKAEATKVAIKQESIEKIENEVGDKEGNNDVIVIKTEPISEETDPSGDQSITNEEEEAKVQEDSVALSEHVQSKLPEKVVAKAKALAAANVLKNVATENNVEAAMNDRGLIGVEYVVKITKSHKDPNPMYECCLCEVLLNESRMQNHLTSYNHRLKYCEMHYGDTIKKYKKAIGPLKYYDFFRVMGGLLSKLALAIENHYGRGIPLEVPSVKFLAQRPKIVAQVYGDHHAHQQHGPSFSNTVSAKEISELIENKKSYKARTIPLNQPGRFATEPEKVYLGDQIHLFRTRGEDRKKKRSRSKTPVVRTSKYHRKRSRTRSRSRSRSRSPSYRKRMIQKRVSPPSDTRGSKYDDIWSVYREQISMAASKTERAYVTYRKNPESHPLYDQEWNRFWKIRKEELVSKGINHRTYNYQPEWVLYFRERLEQLFGEELQQSKINVRKRLNIPLDAEEDSALEPFAATRPLNPHFRSDTVRPSRVMPIAERVEPEAKRHRFEAEIPTTQVAPIADIRPNVIHALRLMTALEDHLGSLGSKIMDLLSKALVLEKTYIDNPRELEQKVLTANNCTLLETAMEKLKGILYAGFLESNKVHGFNRAIQCTTDLLEHADKMGWRKISFDLSERPESGNDLQKLFDFMQDKRPKAASSTQKSLSDTLMELITMQKTNPSADSVRNSSNNNQGKIFNQNSPFGDATMDNNHKQGGQFQQSTRLKANEMGLGMPPNINRNLVNLNRNARFIQYPETSQRSDVDNINCPGGSGRNSYTKLNFGVNNNNKNDNNGTNQLNMVGHVNMAGSMSGFSKNPNNLSSFDSQSNFAQGPNMNWPIGSNLNRNSWGSGIGENWERFSNKGLQWPTKQQLQQYPNQRGGGNM